MQDCTSFSSRNEVVGSYIKANLVQTSENGLQERLASQVASRARDILVLASVAFSCNEKN